MRYIAMLGIVLVGAALLTAADTNTLHEKNFWASHARFVIEGTYGDKISWKDKYLFKFGQNDDADANEETTVMQLQGTETEETYVNTNIIDSVVSNNASNTMAVKIEGHTCSGTGEDLELTFVVQDATLTGTTEVTLTTPLCRATRLYNNSGTELQANSTVFVYDNTDGITTGTPNDDADVHVVLTEAKKNNTSLKASTSISNQDYWAITSGYFGVDKKTGAKCDFKIKIRLPGKVFRSVLSFPTNASGQPLVETPFRPYIIVPKNSDVICTANCDTANTSVSCGLNGMLGLVRGS